MNVLWPLVFYPLLLAPPAASPAPAAEPSPAAAPKYTMVTRYLGLLVKGPKWTREKSPALTKMMEGHMANIHAMAATGKLVAAGPILDDGTLRGIFLFSTANAEEARALAEKDPAIAGGHLTLEIHPWMVAKEVFVEPAAVDTVR
jgi:uncharacterized protein YciI